MTGTHMTLGEGLAPLADLLDGVASAAEAVVLKVMPMDGSPGMVELAAEARFRTPGTDTPLANAMTYASVLGYAATDAMKAYAHHLRHPELLVWAPMINARSGLDAAAIAYWLVEPAISVEERIQRGLAFRLHNSREQRRGPRELTVALERARATIESVKATAAAHSWPVAGRKQRARVGDAELPFPRDAIAGVLAHRQGPDHDTAADVAWWFYSGLTHAAPYALMQFIDRDQVRPTGVPGVGEAPIYISGPMLVTAAASLGRALLNLADAHGGLLGLDRARIHALDGEFGRTVVGMLEAMERSEQREGARPADLSAD